MEIFIITITSKTEFGADECNYCQLMSTQTIEAHCWPPQTGSPDYCPPRPSPQGSSQPGSPSLCHGQKWSLAVQTFAFVLMAFQCVLSSSLNPLPKQGGLESLSVKTQAAKPFSPSAPSVPAVIKPDSPLSVSTACL